ncbi:hypothetical protein AMJ80_08125 [bacterium SM23_31]|nr:MAG: hypothetical protein AMJ80_08125 [bacterium SM23_31]
MSYRILFLNWQDIKHPLGGGAEVYHQEIFKRIAARGHQVTLLCSGYPGLERTETIDGIRIIRKGGRNYFNYMVPFACRRLLAAEPYDIVVDSINKIPLFSPLYIKKIPVIAVVHHLFKTSIFRETIFPLASYVYMSEKLIRTIYGKTPFIVVSESTRQDLIKSGIREELITIIENCVDHSLYRTTGEPKSAIPLVGFLGRIKRYKSVDHLIKAFAIVKKLMPDAKLVIIGDGDNLNDLKNLAKKLHIDESVEFMGFLDKEDKIKILQKCHVVVNPSIKEGWGLTIIESNACGVPAVAADVPGLRDSVKDKETGLLYPYGDIEKCAEYIVKFLTDEPFRTEITKNATAWAAQFNWEHAAESTLEQIEKTIETYKN